MATSTSFPDDMHLTDTISLTNLQLPHPVLAPDVWGVPKAQPALVNLTLQLRAPFHTAADGDALDGSTMHYGMLAKRIRSACGEGGDGREVTRKVAECVDELGRGKEEEGRPRGNVVRSARVEVRFPKAGMYGELGVMMAETWAWGKEGGDGRREVMMVGLPDVKVMTLVGVNACERTARQPVMVGLWVRGVVEGDGLRGWAATFRMERVLVQVCPCRRESDCWRRDDGWD